MLDYWSMMKEGCSLAQQCSGSKKLQTAMWMHQASTVAIFKDFHTFASNRS